MAKRLLNQFILYLMELAQSQQPTAVLPQLNRTYDGKNYVALTGGTLNCVISNDDVHCFFTEGMMENADIGNNKVVKFTIPIFTGADALNALGWTVNEGLMQGSDNNIMASGSATRAQVATILQRFCKSISK